jgi:hypothetical protein
VADFTGFFQCSDSGPGGWPRRFSDYCLRRFGTDYPLERLILQSLASRRLIFSTLRDPDSLHLPYAEHPFPCNRTSLPRRCTFAALPRSTPSDAARLRFAHPNPLGTPVDWPRRSVDASHGASLRNQPKHMLRSTFSCPLSKGAHSVFGDETEITLSSQLRKPCLSGLHRNRRCFGGGKKPFSY